VELAEAGIDPADLAPPTHGYLGTWNVKEFLSAETATYPASGYWPTPLPAGLERGEVRLVSYPIATSQYSSTTLYQVSYHSHSLFFSKMDIGYNPRCG
jgi:hypothetical protein